MGVSTHIPNKCLNTLTKIMRRLYGNEKNWFKVLGGFTVAMTIDHNTFRRNLMKILCNTSHAGCVDSLTELFLKVNDLIMCREVQRKILNGNSS